MSDPIEPATDDAPVATPDPFRTSLLKVEEFGRTKSWAFYPGETWTYDRLVAERGMTDQDFEDLKGRGVFVTTPDPAAVPNLDDDAMTPLLNAMSEQAEDPQPAAEPAAEAPSTETSTRQRGRRNEA